MASETSELTFVRCPSCRSLVPATATRCRICNNPLDSEQNAKADDSDAAKSASRVRQKTITASPDDVALVLKDAEPPAPKPAAVEPPKVAVSSPAQPTPQDDDFDPLGAYLEELDEEVAEPVPAPKPSNVVAATPPVAEPEDDFGFDLFDEPEVAAPAPTVAATPAPVSEAVYDVEEELHLMPEAFEPEAAPEPVAPPPAPPREEPRREIPRPPPVQAKPQQPQPQAGQRPGAQTAPGAQQVKGQGDRRGRDPQPQGGRDGGQQRRDNREQQRHGGGHQNDRRQDEKRGEDRRSNDRRHEHTAPPSNADRGHHGGPKTGKVRPGRLFGWFVSYENPDGRAIELREGKFFVTGSSIRATDLILEDPSISTPHALMAVSGDGGLVIQDLMSDRGVFVRSSQGGGYRREEGTVHVEHGDWVRFGDVEFLVIVVPQGTSR